jgi:hypothetical protein
MEAVGGSGAMDVSEAAALETILEHDRDPDLRASHIVYNIQNHNRR